MDKPEGIDVSKLSGGAYSSLNVGLDFDVNRKATFATGYIKQSATFGAGSANLTSADFRLDFNLWNITRDLKLRAALGLGYGGNDSGSNATFPRTDGTPSVSGHVGGAQAFGGLGLSAYVAKHVQLSAVAVYGGLFAGGYGANGPLAKVKVSLYLGDNRPSSEHVTSMSSNRSIVPMLATAVRALGCEAKDVNDTSGNTFDSIFVTCPENDTHLIFLQSADAMGVFCDDLNDDCLEFDDQVMKKAKELLDASAKPKAAPPAPAPATPAPAASAPAAPAAPAAEPASPKANERRRPPGLRGGDRLPHP